MALTTYWIICTQKIWVLRVSLIHKSSFVRLRPESTKWRLSSLTHQLFEIFGPVPKTLIHTGLNISSLSPFKGTQAWNLFVDLFVETETLWSQGPVTQDFWKSYSIRPRFSTFKHFRACSASDETFPCMLSQLWNAFRVCSASDEIVLHMLNIFWMMSLKWVVISSSAEHVRKIGYSLAEHAWKLVTSWLSMRGNWLLFGWAYAEIGYHWLSIQKKFVFIGIEPCFFPCHPFPCPLFPSLV